jgi:hypothetical protein
MTTNFNLESALATVKMLSTLDKIKLIQHLTSQIEVTLKETQLIPHPSLRGLWRGLELGETEIAQLREEIWSDFPRRNI